jgi:hypothetical protein
MHSESNGMINYTINVSIAKNNFVIQKAINIAPNQKNKTKQQPKKQAIKVWLWFQFHAGHSV